jgi:hypothetical protein
MHSTAISLTLPALTNSQRQQLLEQANLCSLYELFATIPDPRRKEGQRYELPYLLTCLVAALLCNCNSTLAVGEWCREHRVLLERLFGPRRFLCPCDSLYRYLLPRISAEHLEWALADWMRATLVAEADEPIALDGKSIRGATTAEQKAPHLLSFCTHHSQEILLQVRVDEKTNAHSHRPATVAVSAGGWTGLHRRCHAYPGGLRGPGPRLAGRCRVDGQRQSTYLV